MFCVLRSVVVVVVVGTPSSLHLPKEQRNCVKRYTSMLCARFVGFQVKNAAHSVSASYSATPQIGTACEWHPGFGLEEIMRGTPA